MKKITIIIPNYNNEKFIRRALESVFNQDYSEKEIIVVDDGSTDNSVSLIEGFISEGNKKNIKLVRQNNLNAAMARNEGMKNATGDYIMFLDSDDVLEEGVLTKMIDVYKKDETDLVIGSYTEIDEYDSCIGKKVFTDEDVVLDARKKFSRLLNVNPVPSNKMYDLKIIRANNLEWGNVRIGQDLDFYFKYLSLCKKVTIVPWNIYKYRNTKNSMSKTFDFRVFDIVDVFKDIERFYNARGCSLLYKQYIPTLALMHYYMQMSKQIFYKNANVRRLIMKYFSINEKNLDYSLCKNRDAQFKKIYLKFRVKNIFFLIFSSTLYCRYKIKKVARW